ncbi:hypothetical protein L873DRAFT_188185 [Choiromyces venosus 120613-1]|uniref:Uncharacterized protein n=1 Tax=Choiromyces venosus 120613-1 TaxID=1336337 RepID=A0A3N4JFA1_9PEZI|nr:hypothetical protein L873DRAFT_188185 [Choiromyces venosus 120613-1]
MDSIRDNGVSGTAKRGFYFKKMKKMKKSRHTCSMFFILLFITICPNILHLRLSPFLSTRTLSPLNIRFSRPTFYRGQGRVFKNIIRIRNLPFPVQRVKFYDDSEVPWILYGSARYPVQRDPG